MEAWRVLAASAVFVITVYLLTCASVSQHNYRSRLLHAESSDAFSDDRILKNPAESPPDWHSTAEVPRILHQTYFSKDLVPAKVAENIAEFAPQYERRFYDDADILAFMGEHFVPEVAQAFRDLKSGAHKADLFRYCAIYIYGGVYLDIKTVLVQPIQDLFPAGRISTVIGCVPFSWSIYNGIIAAPPRQSVFLTLISGILRSGPAPMYGLFIREFYRYIEHDVGFVREGPLDGKFHNYYLYTESCNLFGTGCEDGRDRYGLCSNIMLDGKRVIKTRYADFPWKKKV